MPIYEYRCESCGRINGAIVLKPADEEGLICARCGSPSLVKVLSRFAYHKSEAQRLREFDPRSPRDDAFYKDNRNVGLWAKKRAQELGADLGPQMDEIVERGRTGRILEDYDI
jgi:putative FmdB family regulatory protein